MNLTNSIVDNMFGGTHAPAQSPENRAWNRANERFFRECSPTLLAYIAKSFPPLNEADRMDVLQETVITFRKSIKFRLHVELKNPERTHIAQGLMFCLCRWKATDALRKKLRINSREIQMDDQLQSQDEAFTATESMAVLNALLLAWSDAETASEEKALSAERRLTVEGILDALVSAGRRGARTVEIFRAAVFSDRSVSEVAAEFGVTPGQVSTQKGEITNQLTAVVSRLLRGFSLEDAINAA